jgi:hypothetical protein
MILQIGLAFGIFVSSNGEVFIVNVHFTYKLPMTPSFFCLFKIEIPFVVKFHLRSTSIYVVKFQILLIFPFLSFVEV